MYDMFAYIKSLSLKRVFWKTKSKRSVDAYGVDFLESWREVELEIWNRNKIIKGLKYWEGGLESNAI